MINAIILASGYGKRMGENKLLLPLGGKKIIEKVIEFVQSCSFKHILLVGREDAVIELAKSKGISTVFNSKAHKGQSEALKLGIVNSPSAEGYMFFTGDQPFIRKENIELIITSFCRDKGRITVPTHGGKRGSPVIFPEDLKEELLLLQGDEGGRAVMRAYPERIQFVEIENKNMFFDIDTPEDYEYAIKWSEAYD